MSRFRAYLPLALGLVLIGIGAYFMRVELASDREEMHIKVIGGMIAAGLLLVVPKQLAEGVKQVGGAIADAWKAKNGGAS